MQCGTTIASLAVGSASVMFHVSTMVREDDLFLMSIPPGLSIRAGSQLLEEMDAIVTTPLK
jgi:hypothetical protein